MKFRLLKEDAHSKARLGEMETAHGKIKTPIFMPVGTAGTVKGIHQHELIEDTLAQIILGNTITFTYAQDLILLKELEAYINS